MSVDNQAPQAEEVVDAREKRKNATADGIIERRHHGRNAAAGILLAGAGGGTFAATNALEANPNLVQETVGSAVTQATPVVMDSLQTVRNNPDSIFAGTAQDITSKIDANAPISGIWEAASTPGMPGGELARDTIANQAGTEIGAQAGTITSNLTTGLTSTPLSGVTASVAGSPLEGVTEASAGKLIGGAAMGLGGVMAVVGAANMIKKAKESTDKNIKATVE
jgi:hypothetical protein